MTSSEHPTLEPLDERTAPADPLHLFRTWLQAARDAGEAFPDAMAVATATRTGRPSARMVILREADQQAFVFYTDYGSRKGRELAHNPQASLVLHWAILGCQVRVEGRVQKVSAKESDDYFRGRSRESQLAAWASHQSRVIAGRYTLEQMWQEHTTRFPGTVPRPPSWGGYRVAPRVMEFWQGRKHRLHDRLRYQRRRDGTWKVERLAP